jgi:signal transduction histidine kinase
MPAPALQIEGSPRALDAVAEHALFRAAQEGLTNVRKHAGATSATLTLDFRLPGRVRLTIADNGRGLPADMARGSGYGLRGLRERIALLGGSVVAGNAPGGGFALTVEVPA